MELEQLIPLTIAVIAGIATVAKAWSAINSRQDAADRQIKQLKDDMQTIPGNDPKVFRSVVDCIQSQHDCTANTNMRRVEDALENIKEDISEIKNETSAWQQQIQAEMVSMGQLIARLKTQLNERTRRGGGGSQ